MILWKKMDTTKELPIIILNEDGTKVLHLEVFCDLFVINGNPFGQDSVTIPKTAFPQKYQVYIKKGDHSEPLGTLTKSSDGVYKLKFSTTNLDQITKLVDANEIQIIYTDSVKSTVILSGQFTLR